MAAVNSDIQIRWREPIIPFAAQPRQAAWPPHAGRGKSSGLLNIRYDTFVAPERGPDLNTAFGNNSNFAKIMILQNSNDNEQRLLGLYATWKILSPIDKEYDTTETS